MQETQWRTQVSVSLATIEARLGQVVTDSMGLRNTMRRIEQEQKASVRELALKLDKHIEADSANFQQLSAVIGNVEKKVILLVGGIIGIEAIILLGLQIYQVLKP